MVTEAQYLNIGDVIVDRSGVEFTIIRIERTFQQMVFTLENTMLVSGLYTITLNAHSKMRKV